jgi:hypothetical protein
MLVCSLLAQVVAARGYRTAAGGQKGANDYRLFRRPLVSMDEQHIVNMFQVIDSPRGNTLLTADREALRLTAISLHFHNSALPVRDTGVSI